MNSNTKTEATFGKQFDLFCDVNSQQKTLQNNTKGGDTQKQKNTTKDVIAQNEITSDNRQTSFLFTEPPKTTEITTEPSVTANNTDNSHTDAVGENTEPTPISADFTENNNQNLVENADISNIIQNLEISVGDVATNAEEIKVKIGRFNSLLFGNHAQINADKYIKEIANFYKNKNVLSFFDALKNFPDTFPNIEYFKTSFYTALIKFKDLEPRPAARVLATPLFAKKFNSIVKNNISLLIDRLVTLNLCGNIKKPSECDIKNFGQFGEVPRHDVFLTSDDLFIDGVVNNTDNTPADIIEIPKENDDFIQQILDITQAKTGTYDDNLPPTEKLNTINIINVADENAPSEIKTANDATNSTAKATTQVGYKFIPSDTGEKNENDFITEATGTSGNNDANKPIPTDHTENAPQIANNGEKNQNSNNVAPKTKKAKKSNKSPAKPKFEYAYNSSYEKIADALDYISSDVGETEWYKFIDALKNAENTFGGDFKSLADKWSRQASNYESKAFESKWKAKKGDIDYKFIFNEAISHGWQNKPARDENYSFSNNFSSQNSNKISNQNSNNKKENAKTNAVPAEVINNANSILSHALEFTNNNFELLKNHYYFKHLTNFHNVYLNYYKEQISAVIPQFDIKTIKNNDVSTAEVISLQFIYFKDDGSTDKRPLTGGGKHFTYFECCKEAAKEPENILFCEGVRTGLAVATALTGSKVLIVCCLDAGNLSKVATKFKTLFPTGNFGFLADNDIKEQGENVGVLSAFKAAEAIEAKLFIPNYLSDVATPTQCDFYDILKHYNEAPFDNKNGVEVIKEILKKDHFSEVSKEISPFKINDYGVVDKSDLCKYSKTIKFSRKKLTATDIENGLSVNDAPINLSAYNIYTALADPKFSGIELKHDTFTDRKSIKRLYANDNKWEEFIPDRDLDAFQRRIEKNPFFENGFENAKTRKMYEDAFRSLFVKNSFDAGHEALKKLPKWDGKERLKNLVRDYLNDTSNANIQYNEAWGIMLGLYIVKRLKADPNGDGVNCDTMFVLYEPKGKTGKSEFAYCLALDEKWVIQTNLAETKDEEQKKKMRGKTIYNSEELDGLTKRSFNSLKSLITTKTHTIRDLYERHSHQYVLRGIHFGSTNDKIVIQANEEPLIRRFAIIEVNHSYVKKHGHINNREAGGIKENLPRILAEALYKYENNGGDAYVNDFYNKTFYPLLMKENQKYVTKGGDWNDIFQAWADKVFYEADYAVPGKNSTPTTLLDGYKPKDLPGLSPSDVMRFCFNEKAVPNSLKTKDCIAVLLANGYVETKTEKFKDIYGKHRRGYENLNYDANKCKKYSSLNEDTSCEMKDNYTSEEF